ncbi:unnamed protein product [Rotaria sordida]|uniref:EF-hand domain-containing protein n=1 Tax=Rotaria sordida TaxID=392033 RepID=A0A814N3J2_9BILA|nr:unnamed protein product [Rotaria sordida]CAF4082341.1 unnamed protein product [Rotaria sordida]
MGGLFPCFQSKISQSLTAQEINILSLKTKLSPKDIQEWYLRFVHCYPYGFLTRQQFIKYYQQLLDEHSIKIKGLIKELFDVFDLNKDDKLDFSEFLLLNVLTNDGSIDDKLNLIFLLYYNKKGKTMSRDELKEFLRNIFDLFDIPSSKIHINQVINKIFEKNSLNKHDRIEWDQFVKEILNDDTLFQELISLDFNQDYSQHYSFIQTYQTF